MVEAIVRMDSDKSLAEISCKSSSATKAYDRSVQLGLQHTTCTSKATKRPAGLRTLTLEALRHCGAKLRLAESTTDARACYAAMLCPRLPVVRKTTPFKLLSAFTSHIS